MTITAKGDTDNTCAMLSFDYTPADDTCTDFGLGTFTLVAYDQWSARTPTGGSCTATPTTDASKSSSTTLRACVANDATTACRPPAPGERKCVVSEGTPCGGEYPNAVEGGDSVTIACGACTCARSATKCIVDYFSDGACNTTPRWTQDLDGVCRQTNSATNVRYFKVHATGLTCTATADAATASLTNPRTLCCN
jgi:hypothetical protein